MTEASRQKRINQTIKRAQEQGLDVSAKNLVECLFRLSDDEDSDDSWDGDCCLKDLANNQEQKETLRTDMASVDEDKNHKKKNEVIYHKKAALTKQNQRSGHKYFLQKIRKRKEEQSMFPIRRKRKDKRKRGSISKE